MEFGSSALKRLYFKKRAARGLSNWPHILDWPGDAQNGKWMGEIPSIEQWLIKNRTYHFAFFRTQLSNSVLLLLLVGVRQYESRCINV